MVSLSEYLLQQKSGPYSELQHKVYNFENFVHNTARYTGGIYVYLQPVLGEDEELCDFFIVSDFIGASISNQCMHGASTHTYFKTGQDRRLPS